MNYLELNQRSRSPRKSKVEIYRLIASVGGVYLSPSKDTNYQFLRDVLTGDNKVFILVFYSEKVC